MIPISLLVTLECVRFCQAIMISWDAGMFNSKQNRAPSVQSSNLNEELGSVKVL